MQTAMRNFHIGIIECPQHRPHMSNKAFGYDENKRTLPHARRWGRG